MALGISFLTKSAKLNGNQLTGAFKQHSTVKSFGLSSQNAKKSEKTEKADLTELNTSDMINNVYNNQKEDDKQIKLPITVKYNNQDFSAHGKSFDEVVADIAKKTNDSKTKIASELKRNYGSVKGGSLNMQA